MIRLNGFVIMLLLLLNASLLSQQKDRSFDPKAGDLKNDFKSIRYVDKTREGCCKIKYPSGGYDFFVATEEDCRQNLYFDRFLGENNSLCFQWRE
jgi:hypothetical protein